MREKKKPMIFCSRISISLIAALLLVIATFPVASAMMDNEEVTSCNSTGFEINEFALGEKVYVKATGLGMNKDYKIWIQEDPVTEGHILAVLNPPENLNQPIEPVLVATDSSGDFGPTEIWHIPADAPITHHQYDIVVDRQSGGGTVEDTYNARHDGLDSSADVVGITAPVPDVSALILFASGLVLVLVYLDYGRRRKKEVLK